MPQHEENRDLGATLRLARMQAGMTQSDLAARAEVRLDTLRSIEQGRTTNPGIWTIARLAEHLGQSLDSLVRGEVR